MDDNPRPTKRARKSCERCRTRKQKCVGFPVCSNCESAKEECKQPASAIEEYKSGPNQALLERISFLESQLAAYSTSSKSEYQNDGIANGAPQFGSSPANSDEETQRGNFADIVGFLSLGGESAYVGSASGFSIASSLGNMVQATVWNKALTSAVSRQHTNIVSLAEVKRNSAGPPNDDMGGRILDAYFTRTHNRYPFLDRSDIMERHANRFVQNTTSIEDQFGNFKMYMIYAIGSTMLRLTEAYDYTPPENFFMTALQYISSARESHTIHNIQAMTLLVLYNLRSPSNSGIWYMIGLAMRTCVDVGLHREAHYAKIAPYEGQLRRRLFWTVYFLERVIATSLGRPFGLAERDIDVTLPLEIDDTVRDDGLIARTLAVAPSPTFQASRPSSNLTLGVQCIRLMRLESYIQTTIYRVDRPTSSLVPKITPTLRLLEEWQSTLPPFPAAESDYLNMHYNKAIRLLLQPFLTILPVTDPRIALCLHASGQICQIFKRLHQRDSYGHSFIALHSVFMAGVTMCYTLFLCRSLWTFTVSNDLRACSTALFVMAERSPAIKKYRDALECVISATMEFMASPQQPPTPQATTSTTPSYMNPTILNASSPNNIATPSRSLSFSSDSLSMPAPNPPQYTGTMPSPRESYVRSTTTSPPKPPHYQSQPTKPSAFTQDYPSYAPYPYQYDPSSPVQTQTPTQSRWNSSSHRAGIGAGAGGGGLGLGGGGEQIDSEWLLTLCEGDGFSLQMLNEMMKFEPSMGM